MSNIGGAATMVGDPPALIIGTALSQYLSFMDFIVNMAPGVIMAAAACVPLLLWMYRSALMGPIQDYDGVLAEVAGYRITDWPLFAKSGVWAVSWLVTHVLAECLLLLCLPARLPPSRHWHPCLCASH